MRPGVFLGNVGEGGRLYPSDRRSARHGRSIARGYRALTGGLLLLELGKPADAIPERLTTLQVRLKAQYY
jgi:hypothetical protein